MEYIGAEVSHKIRSAIKAKLMELGAYVDEELPDYIMVMVANKRAKAQMDGDLQLFLGSNTSHFTSWLYQVLQKLQEVTVGNLDKKSSKISSSVMKDTNSAKRKSTGIDSDSHRKEKRRKSSDNKKSKKVDGELIKEIKKDPDAAFKSSSKLPDTDKYSRSHSSKEFVSSSRSENSDSVVSSSADSKTSRKLILKEKVEKSLEPENIKRNSLKSSLSNGSSKAEDKTYLSRLRAEALRSRDERIGNAKLSGATDEVRALVSVKDERDAKVSGGKTVHNQPLQRTKIILMNSDDEDDDEDFINIKADAEAEQLLKEELPREALEASVGTPETTPSVAEAAAESSKKVPEGPAPPPSELPTIPLKEDLVPKRPLVKEAPTETSPQASPEPVSAPSVPVKLPSVTVSSRILRKRIADLEAEASEAKIAKEEKAAAAAATAAAAKAAAATATAVATAAAAAAATTAATTAAATASVGLSVKERLGTKKPSAVSVVKDVKATARLGTRQVSSEQRASNESPVEDDASDTVRKKTSSNSSVSSRVVMLRDRTRPERREKSVESRGPKREEEDNEEEEEEYDPNNPAVGTVASVVRVKPRPKLPASLQANKNLILKAVAEAQKSVANAPIRVEPERSGGLWKRTSSGFVRKLGGKVGVTLPNRHLRSFKDENSDEEEDEDSDENEEGEEDDEGEDDDEVDEEEGEEEEEENIKPDSTRHVSGGNGHDKIIIKVSSTKREKGQEETSTNSEDVSEDENTTNILEYQEEANTNEDADGLTSGRSVYPPVGLASRMPRESPQFLVTLDGLDPDMFESRSTSFDEQTANKEDYDLDNGESSGSIDNNTPKKMKTPIVYKIDSTAVEDSSEPSTLPKSLERCKYWPSCRLGAKCNFHHPITPCKAFPKCPFADKCLYIHPFCKFNSACTRRDCPFVHAAPRALVAPVARPSFVPKPAYAPVCRFFPKCSNVSCRFMHPKACRYGKFCAKQDCTFIHQQQDLPPVDKLKWTSPFKA